MNQPAANPNAIANATSAYVIWVEFDIHPERLAQFTSLVRINAAASLANEPGCQRFDVLLPTPDRATVALYEIYDDEAAFAAHLASPHFKTFAAAIQGFVRERRLQAYGLLPPVTAA
jgi:quinol monooxygenase YgiN